MISFDARNGYFIESTSYRTAVAAFDDLLSEREASEISDSVYVIKLKSLIKRHPDFLDGYAHLGFAQLEIGKAKAALEACEKGLAISRSIIPARYDGLIEWGWLENRPFLRLLYATVLALLTVKQRGRAIEMMQRILKWNPGDNQGIRFIIGSAMLRDGDIQSARSWFEKCASEYPPYHYELGLLHFREKEFGAAAMSLRMGFIENGYIAEVLNGASDPTPLPIWHGSNFAAPDLAIEYIEQNGVLWRKVPSALDFLRWLYAHPAILRERADMIECRQALQWEGNPSKRSNLLDKLAKLTEAINLEGSIKLVTPVFATSRKIIYPWMPSQPRLVRDLTVH